MSQVQETKIVSADPTALGVFGLSLITFVASSSKLGWTSNSIDLIPWAICLGSFAQLWAAAIDFKRNSYFGATVLGAFGLFWLGVAVTWAIHSGFFGADIASAADMKQFGYACFGYLIFCAFVTVTAFECNKVFGVILVLILVLLASLGLQILGINKELFGPLAGYSELLISLLGFYAAGAIYLNTFFGRQILPLGKPMGWVKKAA
ncbi:MAG: acetate uptake transporter [Azoarcus sp.]|jgi:succinate-acetate transporter protein|nr:acetate uptake transporter [Azoarcus sp.]